MNVSAVKPARPRIVGNPTPCVSVSPTGHVPDGHMIWLKLEGDNPARSHKYRVARAITAAAQKAGRKGVAVGTCGNLGLALAIACRDARLQCRVFVPRHYIEAPAGEIRALGALVRLIDGTYEQAVEASQEEALRESLYCGSPVGEAAQVSLEAYAPIADEIVEILGGPPDSVWTPIGNGTTIAGIASGFRRLGAPVRYGVVGSAGNNAAVATILAGTPIELLPNLSAETPINAPLVSWAALHATEAAAAVSESRGWAFGASDEALREASDFIVRVNGPEVPPYAAAGIAGWLNFAKRSEVPIGNHVIVVTAQSSGAE